LIYSAPGFLHKSGLGLVTQELGRKVYNFDVLGWKIDILYFFALSATALKKLYRCRQLRFKNNFKNRTKPLLNRVRIKNSKKSSEAY
jgi:hypothetical protein